MQCQLCGQDLQVGDHKWVVTNRIVVGEGDRFQMIEGTSEEDGTALWDLEEGVASGIPLCWPGCFSVWTEGDFVAMEVAQRNGDAE